MYVDEAGIENTLDYAHGWSLKGTRCLAEKLAHQNGQSPALVGLVPFTKRVSMIAAWCQGEVFAPMTSSGYCDSILSKPGLNKFLFLP